jgi:hypothetical protein
MWQIGAKDMNNLLANEIDFWRHLAEVYELDYSQECNCEALLVWNRRAISALPKWNFYAATDKHNGWQIKDGQK